MLKLAPFSLHLVWERFFIPFHHSAAILVIFLEACEFLENNYATSIMEMVRSILFRISVHTSSHSCSILFNVISVINIVWCCHTQQEFQPEVSIFHVIEIFVIKHWEAGHSSGEIGSVCSHPMFECLSIRRSHSIWVCVVEMNDIMYLRRMEASWFSQWISSNCSAICTRHTTIIVT